MNTPIRIPAIALTNICDEGLLLNLGGRDVHAAWGDVEDVALDTMDRQAAAAFTMAIELADGRIIVSTKDQPVWRMLIEALPLSLPGITPFSDCAAALVKITAAVLVLFSRPPIGHA